MRLDFMMVFILAVDTLNNITFFVSSQLMRFIAQTTNSPKWLGFSLCFYLWRLCLLFKIINQHEDQKPLVHWALWPRNTTTVAERNIVKAQQQPPQSRDEMNPFHSNTVIHAVWQSETEAERIFVHQTHVWTKTDLGHFSFNVKVKLKRTDTPMIFKKSAIVLATSSSSCVTSILWLPQAIVFTFSNTHAVPAHVCLMLSRPDMALSHFSVSHPPPLPGERWKIYPAFLLTESFWCSGKQGI